MNYLFITLTQIILGIAIFAVVIDMIFTLLFTPYKKFIDFILN